jgi:membrane protein implicated in regulation of membrane protease activity
MKKIIFWILYIIWFFFVMVICNTGMWPTSTLIIVIVLVLVLPLSVYLSLFSSKFKEKRSPDKEKDKSSEI